MKPASPAPVENTLPQPGLEALAVGVKPLVLSHIRLTADIPEPVEHNAHLLDTRLHRPAQESQRSRRGLAGYPFEAAIELRRRQLLADETHRLLVIFLGLGERLGREEADVLDGHPLQRLLLHGIADCGKQHLGLEPRLEVVHEDGRSQDGPAQRSVCRRVSEVKLNLMLGLEARPVGRGVFPRLLLTSEHLIAPEQPPPQNEQESVSSYSYTYMDLAPKWPPVAVRLCVGQGAWLLDAVCMWAKDATGGALGWDPAKKRKVRSLGEIGMIQMLPLFLRSMVSMF